MRIVVGVTGSIAAYRSPDLVKELVRQGHEVQVVLTRAAGELVSARVLSTFSERAVLSHDVFSPEYASTDHISTARWAELFLVYGATADFLGRYANGLADDFLTLQLLAATTPVCLAPAMNPAMWEHPAVQANVRRLRERGVQFVGPIHGRVACGETGVGHVAEMPEILAAVGAQTLGVGKAQPQMPSTAPGSPGILAGKKLLISAGPMRTSLDSVRYVQNRSSGRMGLEIARAAQTEGAQVTVLLGPVEDAMAKEFSNPDFQTHRYSDPESYGSALDRLFVEADVFLSLAAVLDFELVAKQGKMERESLHDSLSLPLKQVPDFVARMASRKKPHQTVIAFAAEAGNEDEILERARKKLLKKSTDAIVANPVWPGVGPESADNRLWVLKPGTDEVISMGPAPKSELALPLLRELLGSGLAR